ncbi:hypothetical protein [Actinophytocola xanthii]|uniref:Uncharacterized protein n=1 Tax=Actinophytocola xanthii TaxID=1912961 RepID=A0A1Q8BXU3_9PSEU|nr:hypothetical protein [Actinophytocola xanthii]OLF06923.1 hypothetical protein BU204_36015 [Actinophytocola xanthii]
MEELTAAFAELRDVDPCTLLDRAVIKNITDAQVGIHIPGRHLSECQVDTEIDKYTPGWSFAVDVGLFYEATEDIRHERIDTEMFFIEGDEYRCTYTRMVNANVGVALTATIPPPIEGRPAVEDPCEMAKSYLAETGTTFIEMGRREQQLTEPQLPLATRDPCETVDNVAQAMNTEAIGVPIKTYLCSIQPAGSTEESPLAGQNLSVGYEFIPDPRDDVPADEPAPPAGADGLGAMTAVTIAGHAGSQFDGAGDLGCSVDLVLDDKPSLQDGALTLVQVVSVLSNDCEVTHRVAEAVITTISRS